jgi:hypothetical protein
MAYERELDFLETIEHFINGAKSNIPVWQVEP